MGKKQANNSYLRDLINGDVYPTDKQKYNIICYVLATIHMIFCILMFILKFKLLGIYYAFTVYLYVVTLTVTLRKDLYYRVFFVAYLEILFTSCLMTYLCGWSWGYMMYVIALCPVSFFVTYSLNGIKRSMSRPWVFSLFSLFIFCTTRVLTSLYTPPYSGLVPDYIETLFYLLNCIITFVSIIAFSSLFALDLRNKEKVLEDQNLRLSNISIIDPLTRLINRRAMDKYLRAAVDKTKSSGELFTIAIGDIDNFKMVNDVHGHNVGDDVLRMVAKTLADNLPKSATLCRWGGEEFLILIRRPESESLPYIESMRYAITQVVTKVEKPEGYIDLGVTMTFGVSQYIHGYSIDQVISVADANLYAGKANGKNRVVSSKSLL